MAGNHKNTHTQDLSALLKRWAVVLALLGLFAAWAGWRMNSAARRLAEAGGHAATPDGGRAGTDSFRASQAGHAPKWYRCTMPECGDVGSDDPTSRCPVCGMKRETVVRESPAHAFGDHIALSERARLLADVATEPLMRRRLFKRIRTVGKVSYDETRRQIISAYTAGRIDKLYADYTGMTVARGDRLAEIYSPMLISAQEEYLRRYRAKQSTDKVWLKWASSSRRKLELLGFSLDQVQEIEKADEPATHLVVYAPMAGTIVHKDCLEGMYVQSGDRLYEIADLTRVWLLLDLYEADLPWIQPLQEVLVTAESLPGQEFEGRVIFVDPVVDDRTRTIKVRVDVHNPQRQLKPQMYVTAEITVAVDEQGRALATGGEAQGFACRVHPWERSMSEDRCPTCDGPLTPTPAAPRVGQQAVLSVPREAVLHTGERTLVYREVQPGTYEPVPVRIGPLARSPEDQEFYPLLSGLAERDRVVTRGNFLIDSQMQITRPRSTPATAPAAGSHPAGLATRDDPGGGDLAAKGTQVQTLCPVMGLEIDPDVFTTYKGIKIFFCCPGCDAKFLGDPEKYTPNLPRSVQLLLKRSGSHSGVAPGG